MEKKGIVIFGPYAEFTEFIKFNSLIGSIKKAKIYNEVIVVVPYVACAVLSAADKIITVSRNFHRKSNADYPDILEMLDHYGRIDHGYGHSGFMSEVLRYVEEKYSIYDIAIYGNDDISPFLQSILPSKTQYVFHMMHEGKKFFFSQDYIYKNCMSATCDAFVEVGNDLRHGLKILPFEEDYKNIKDRFGHLFSKKTYVLHTRGFKQKQPGVYNAEKGIVALGYRNVLERLLSEGYKIINVGFPPAQYSFTNKNYIEFTEDLSYSEYLSFCYLARGWIMFSDAGGWLNHICSTLDLFSIGPEWEPFARRNSKYKPLLENRVVREDLFTVDLRNSHPEKLYEAIKKHIPSEANKKFSSLNERVIILD